MKQDNKNKGVIYLRVSREESESLPFHKAQLLELAERRGIEVVGIFEEKESGANDNRPQLLKMLELIEEYEYILVKAIDRISRNDVHALQLRQLFRMANVKVLTTDKEYNFDIEGDDFMYSLQSLFAKIEHTKIKERMRTGKINRFKQGGYAHGGSPPLGYKIGEEGSLVVEENGAKLVRLIFKLSVEGKSAHSIQKYLKSNGILDEYGLKLPPNHIRHILSNRVYLGELSNTIYNIRGEVEEVINVLDAHEPLITLETWIRSTEKKNHKERAKNFLRGETHSFFQGAIRCKYCNQRLHLKTGKSIKRPMLKRCDNPLCEKRPSGVAIDLLEPLLLDELNRYRSSLIVTLNMADELDTDGRKATYKAEIEKLQQTVNELDRRKLHLKTLLKEMIIDLTEYREDSKVIDSDIKVINDEILYLKEELVKLDTVALINRTREGLENIEKVLDLSRSVEDRNEALKNVVEVIYYDRDTDGILRQLSAEDNLVRVPVKLNIKYYV